MAGSPQGEPANDEPHLVMDTTARGFPIARGFDRYGEKWSVQDSSLAGEAAIWLGNNESRAHLTQAMAAELIPMLCRFVATGTIADAAPKAAA